MSNYLMPGLLFGCSAFPAAATPTMDTTDAPATVDIEAVLEAVGPGDLSRPINKLTSGWSNQFGFWSRRSRSAMVDAISAESHDSAEILELEALTHVWKALSTISDHELSRLEVNAPYG